MLHPIIRAFLISALLVGAVWLALFFFVASLVVIDGYSVVAVYGILVSYILLSDNLMIHDKLYAPSQGFFALAILVLTVICWFMFGVAIMLNHRGDNGQAYTQDQLTWYSVLLLAGGFAVIVVNILYLALQCNFTPTDKLVFAGSKLLPSYKRHFFKRNVPDIRSFDRNMEYLIGGKGSDYELTSIHKLTSGQMLLATLPICVGVAVGKISDKAFEIDHDWSELRRTIKGLASGFAQHVIAGNCPLEKIFDPNYPYDFPNQEQDVNGITFRMTINGLQREHLKCTVSGAVNVQVAG